MCWNWSENGYIVDFGMKLCKFEFEFVVSEYCLQRMSSSSTDLNGNVTFNEVRSTLHQSAAYSKKSQFTYFYDSFSSWAQGESLT